MTKPIFTLSESAIGDLNQEKVGNMVLDGLQEILPHVPDASPAEIMMAYIVMIKVTFMSLPLSEAEKDKVKSLLDQMWPDVFVNPPAFAKASDLVH